MTARPVTVLTGFLGAGKTSAVNAVLRGQHGKRFAVIVNEFGEVGIDGALIDSGAEEMIELANGCVCCTVRGDLLRTLHGLVAHLDRIDGVLIELSGLADPAPVVQSFLMDDALRPHFRLDGIVTLVDALNVEEQLATQAEAQDQIAFADLIVLNKTDLVKPNDLPQLTDRLRAVNPLAKIITAQRGKVDANDLFGRNALDLAHVGSLIAESLDRGGAHAGQDHDHDHRHHHAHQSGPRGIETAILRATEPLDGDRLGDWMADLLAREGGNILRGKGLLDVAGDDRQLALQSVQMILEGDFLAPWPAGPRESRLVLIGRHLDVPALERGFQSCIAATAKGPTP